MEQKAERRGLRIMKLIVQILLALAAVAVLYWALAALLGYLIGALVVAGLAAGAFALIRHLIVGRERHELSVIRSVKRAEKDAEKTLREMEAQARRERSEG
jgi:hypothetical protein